MPLLSPSPGSSRQAPDRRTQDSVNVLIDCHYQLLSESGDKPPPFPCASNPQLEASLPAKRCRRLLHQLKQGKTLERVTQSHCGICARWKLRKLSSEPRGWTVGCGDILGSKSHAGGGSGLTLSEMQARSRWKNLLHSIAAPFKRHVTHSLFFFLGK